MQNLKKTLKLFENNKIKLIQLWISNQKVINLLDKYNIKKELFIKNFAFSMVDYIFEIIKDNRKIGKLPVIDNLLKFLNDKNIYADELFILCLGLKNSFFDFTYNTKIDSMIIHKELSSIFGDNFQKILEKYFKLIQQINRNLNISNHLVDENLIMSSTDLEGNITSVSQAFCNISGYTKEELIGKAHSIVRHPDTQKEVFEELWETIKSGKTWKGEVKNLKKCGGFYWVFATISPNFNSSGNITGYSAIRHNITSKKEVENQQSLIIEQSKSAAMGEMIAMLAHQWRQPLQATAMLLQQLTLERMLDGAISDETLEKVTSGTQKQIDYMSKTIDDFRDFFKPNKDKLKIRINSLVERSRELIAYTLKVDNIKLIIDVRDDIEINVHINEIVQTLINLVKNARDALLESSIDDKKITIISYEQNENIVIKVKDNAGGIPDMIIGQIFDAYFSTKKNKNGTGLGLYMSKNIIENHGQGLLTVSNEDDGAVFKIILPIS